MKVNVSKKINYILESYMFLFYRSMDKEYKYEFKYNASRKFNVPDIEIYNIIAKEEKLYNIVNKKIKLNDEAVSWYFQRGEERNSSLAEILLSYMIYDDKNLNEFIELDDNEKFAHYLKIILSINSIDIAVKKDMKQSEYINLIDTLDIPVEFKYKYVLLYQNHKRYFEEVIDMINLVSAELKKEEHKFHDIIDEYERIVNDKIEKADGNFFDFMDVQFQYDGDILLRPAIMANNVVLISSFMRIHNAYPDKKFDQAIVYFGVNVIAFSKLFKKHELNEDKLTSILKILGDRSKYDILMSLKGKQMYAAEIAKMMNVTNATVSHHMRNLFQLALVRMITDNNRVYYTLNENTIKKVVDLLGKKFLD